jgi:hypothetical protein
MTTNLQLYTNAHVYINGSCLSQESSVTISRTTNAQDVITVVGGFSGQVEGAKMLELTVENAVPSADFEMNPGSFMSNLDVVEFTVVAAGRTLTTTGFINSDNFSHAANTESKLSFSAKCKFADWE